ncbi:MAG: Uma2 family endonuclease [Campylobacterota bacterium]|nr:Uma2 family endonuclease [Campylobacterota bacterium]
MGERVYEEYYTYEDYLNWNEPEWELIDGFPYAMSPKPMIKHQQVSGKIFSQLDKSSCEKCLVAMEIDYKVSEDTVVSPDVLLACGEDLGDKYLKKTPSIVFEVLSPSTQRKDRNEKYKLYESEGIKYYIIVDSQTKEAEVYLLENSKYKLEKKTSDESFLFEIDRCEIELEFGKIWA